MDDLYRLKLLARAIGRGSIAEADAAGLQVTPLDLIEAKLIVLNIVNPTVPGLPSISDELVRRVLARQVAEDDGFPE